MAAGKLREFVHGYFVYLGGPVTFAREEWRARTESGSSPAVRVAWATCMSMVGIGVAFMTLLFTVIAVIALLYWFGFDLGF
jgi:hypothetical protein